MNISLLLSTEVAMETDNGLLGNAVVHKQLQRLKYSDTVKNIRLQQSHFNSLVHLHPLLITGQDKNHYMENNREIVYSLHTHQVENVCHVKTHFIYCEKHF